MRSNRQFGIRVETLQQEIKPLAEEMDRTGEFPYEVVRKMGDWYCWGCLSRKNMVEAGADFLSYCIAIEEISRGDVSVGITMEAHTSLGPALLISLGVESRKSSI